MAQALAEADLRDALPRIAVPTLLLYGDATPDPRWTWLGALRSSIPGSTLKVLPGLGHECYLEAPELFETEVRTFLSAQR